MPQKLLQICKTWAFALFVRDSGTDELPVERQLLGHPWRVSRQEAALLVNNHALGLIHRDLQAPKIDAGTLGIDRQTLMNPLILDSRITAAFFSVICRKVTASCDKSRRLSAQSAGLQQIVDGVRQTLLVARSITLESWEEK